MSQTALRQRLQELSRIERLSADEALLLAECDDLTLLGEVAQALCLEGHGTHVTYSRKVFIPLTKLCRDICHYCTFSLAPKRRGPAYLSLDDVLDIARRGAAAGCKEALFTLGDKPELRYPAVRRELDDLGYASTLDYLEVCAQAVHQETGLLPHINAGLMDEDWLARFKKVSPSQGLMLESTSTRLCERGGAHFGSPDKVPARRLEMLEAAGRQAIPFTTGLLIGIGETRHERLDTLLAIRALNGRYGHIQEVIVQNFRAKAGTRMAGVVEPSLDELIWTVAAAKIVLGAAMNIQAPPNLSPNGLTDLISAGINDWGGVSPVTCDHVNPEAPWPELEQLEKATVAAGRTLVERLTIYPAYAHDPKSWLAPEMRPGVLSQQDSQGLAREDDWFAGSVTPAPALKSIAGGSTTRPVEIVLAKIGDGDTLGEHEIVSLFEARGNDAVAVCAGADFLRRKRNGDVVTYVVNRNINYTNICSYACRFCAFSKGRLGETQRDKPYDLSLSEIGNRVREATAKGATEVCLQGGIRPGYTGDTYLSIVEVVKDAAPDIHVHAFSPLEIWHGATTMGLPLADYLRRLKTAGLASLPGTAAEILDDEVRAELCADKVNTQQWLEVMETAHDEGLASTATIMFGHVDRYEHWARHLLRVRALQERTGGFTEFVPLPFVHMEAPIYLKGEARRGPTFREAVLMHAVSRLVLDPVVTNIQASWVKMGPDGAAACLNAGCNDLGGVLMNESITRSAGASHGQEFDSNKMQSLIASINRVPQQRTTLYRELAVRVSTPGPRSIPVSLPEYG